MQYIRSIVIVCGYGCDLETPLKTYLDRVLEYCRARRPVALILCGGATQRKSSPGKTEASVMHGYLRPVERELNLRVYELANSYTTFENIRDATQVVHQLRRVLGDRGNEYTVFCEATRALKVAILTRHFLGFPPADGEPDILIETVSWNRENPRRQLFGTIKDWLSTKFPVIDAIQSWRVRRKSERR